jgi:hypothetical protein
VNESLTIETKRNREREIHMKKKRVYAFYCWFINKLINKFSSCMQKVL